VSTRNRPGSLGSVMDALRVLRMMMEGRDTHPLSPESIQGIRQVARERLTGSQAPSTLWNAIDLAVGLNDPSLRLVVDSLASNASAVQARGISDPSLVARTQLRAAVALAGLAPLPRQ